MKDNKRTLADEITSLKMVHEAILSGDKRVENVRREARRWKKRAVTAEERCRELLVEREQNARQIAQMAADMEQLEGKLAQTKGLLKDANDDVAAYELELQETQAHAYRLMMGKD